MPVDVVGFDIDVYTARVFDALQNHTRIGWITPHVKVTPAGARAGHFTTERSTPEFRFTLQIIGLAIYNNGTQSTFVHFAPLVYMVGR